VRGAWRARRAAVHHRVEREVAGLGYGPTKKCKQAALLISGLPRLCLLKTRNATQASGNTEMG
jgi:hypothetical protein